MEKLNPALKSFDISDESHGPKGQWNYGVYYTEYFELLPKFMENSAVAKYQVIRENRNSYKIDSQHVTCMIPTLNWFCLETKAQDKFITTTSKKNCKIEETINYECPLILIPLCRAELTSQRRKVLSNLKNQLFENV